MIGTRNFKERQFIPALIDRERATLGKTTPWRRIDRAGRVAVDEIALLEPVAQRTGRRRRRDQ